MRTVRAIRYVTPLREGGSLPAVVEADDGQQYVMKFVGAGQGAKALIAEVIAGQIALTLDLPMPELVFIEMDAELGRSEPDPEIQDLLNASVGLNLGMRYLPGALAYNPMLPSALSPTLASRIVWFDAYITNVDRTSRNVNMLLWEDQLWLIDHGASLYFHHSWAGYLDRSGSAFPLVKDHTLLPLASELTVVDPVLRQALTNTRLTDIVDLVPEIWLTDEELFTGPDAHRAAYVSYLEQRRERADNFVEEAINARAHQL